MVNELSLTEAQERFTTQGYLEPTRVFTTAECRNLKAVLLKAPEPLDWSKGHAANSAGFARLGRDPRIVERVVDLIGEDVLLWGASVVRRSAGRIHPWHTDIESSFDAAGTVSVWIGLENTRPGSSLFLLPGSHRLGSPVQEQAFRAGKTRDEVTTDDVREWAGALGNRHNVTQPPVADGEALIFDGRLWHGSHNVASGRPRLAVLLQYARPDVAIRMPESSDYDYPFHLLDEPRPPCIMVHGSSGSEVNRIVPSPHASSADVLSWCSSLRLPGDEATGFRPHGFFFGATGCLTYLDCHASVLNTGKSPHVPHTHADEEMLVIVDGAAELELVVEEGKSERHPVTKGSFAYYPAGQAHTIHNVEAEPVTYLMFRWNARGHQADVAVVDANQLPAEVYHFDELPRLIKSDHRPGFSIAEVFRGPTGHLPTLQCHHSRLEPGDGYDPHIDSYDVGLVLLEGAVQTLGEDVEAPAVVFYAAGEPHGIRNVGDVAATYLVFEFHATARERRTNAAASRLIEHVPASIRTMIPDGLRRRLRRALLGR